MARRGNRQIRDIRQLKALAHPLRVRLYYALVAERAATATHLSELVSESPALVSYHLQQLGLHGFLEEAPELARDQRERWWRPTSRAISWSATDFDATPEHRAVSATAKRLLIANQLERLQSFNDEEPAWGRGWIAASFASDALLRLTHEELAELHNELRAVIQRWVTRTSAHADAERPAQGAVEPAGTDDAEGEREHVMILLHGFPFRP